MSHDTDKTMPREYGRQDALRGWPRDLDGCTELGDDDEYLSGYAEGEASRTDAQNQPTDPFEPDMENMKMAKLDFSTLKLPIKKGKWRDADDRMFHACFVILGQYVEGELGTKPWSGGEEAMYRGYRRHSGGDSDEKAIDLWLWYRDELPALQQDYARDLNECYSGGLTTQKNADGLREVISFGCVREPKYTHDYPETVKDAKLRELIDLRMALWT